MRHRDFLGHQNRALGITGSQRPDADAEYDIRIFGKGRAWSMRRRPWRVASDIAVVVTSPPPADL